jgi:hypothetical protein
MADSTDPQLISWKSKAFSGWHPMDRATARAMVVFPVPLGPMNMMAWGTLVPPP